DRGDAEEFYRIRRIADRGLPGLLCAAVDGGPRGRGYRNAGGDRAAEIRHCADSGAGGDGDDRVESKPEATHDRSERHEIADGRRGLLVVVWGVWGGGFGVRGGAEGGRSVGGGVGRECGCEVGLALVGP